MSNFLRKGRRQSSYNKKKLMKKHIKEVYKIIHEMDIVAKDILLNDEEVTEDNIEEIASKYTSRTIDTFEKNILLSKILGSNE